MDDEFGESAAAQFVEVHTEAFAIGIRAEGNYAVEKPEEQVDKW